MNTIPKKYKHTEIESKWIEEWDRSGIYRWDPERPRSDTFVVDTPPPTVSGSLHVGHVFSYTHTDVVVRFQRMIGKNIFYPMGWDDNGLPTERRVQNYFGIRCDPHLPYDPEWKPRHISEKKKDEIEMVSRQNFIEACERLTVEDEKEFKRLWSRLGLSVDWSLEYATIDDHCRKISQLSFLDLVQKGEAYSTESPTMWDIDFQSAIAQAELEDKEIGGAFHDIRFQVSGSDAEFVIATTRPELLPACIAVVAHPDDERYQPLFGKEAITPLFHAPVPIEPSEHADPEKGSGILMVCTFGDIMDVEWWQQSGLPLKQVIGRDGCLREVTFGEGAFRSNDPSLANTHYGKLQGLPVKKARRAIVELLQAEGSAANGEGSALVGEPKQIQHTVKFYEKGDRPIEFVPTRQWYVKILQHKEALVAQGEKISWHPHHMFTRYEHWVNGLNQDWCYSRQRYFGVPFPVWYPISSGGEVDYENPIFASEDALPVDPLLEAPEGFDQEQRGKPGGFTGDPDVMDTWATSSMTPQIMSHWKLNQKRHQSVFPMDLRPQAHDIIRTWAFSTITKAYLHEGEVPWRHIALSGWILDPDRKKMSKSKGNVVTPQHLLEEYSSDAVRYWAARARLGTDTAFDDKVFQIGRKLTTKIFNASKFVLMQLERAGVSPHDTKVDQTVCELDRAFLRKLHQCVQKSTKSFFEYDYAGALQSVEDLFWEFCDHYLEAVKPRSYSEEESQERTSALAGLGVSLRVFLRLFAPALPYVSEEVWSWSFAASETDSIHTSSWPAESEFEGLLPPDSEESFELAKVVLGRVRAEKTAAQKSQKWPLSSLSISGPEQSIRALEGIQADLVQATNLAGSVIDFSLSGEEMSISLSLAESREN